MRLKGTCGVSNKYIGTRGFDAIVGLFRTPIKASKKRKRLSEKSKEYFRKCSPIVPQFIFVPQKRKITNLSY